MVRKVFLVYFFLLFPALVFCAEFTASVKSSRVALGDSFTLTLKLSDAKAKGSPDISALKTTFLIYGQQQSQSTMITNGKVSSYISWQLTLIPEKEGKTTIPSLSIDTSDGTLSSKPIEIEVVGKGGSRGDLPKETGMTLTTKVGKAAPYQNEPVTYTVKLISKHDVANVSMQKLTIEDAIVESAGEPLVSETIIDGIRFRTIEYTYLITPLKAGSLSIPPVFIQGGVPSKKKSRRSSFFDDDFDPFHMFSQFERLEPFALSTDRVELDVQPPVPGVEPWTPARSLRIEEVWDEQQKLQVGEPLTLGISITAEGVKANFLPSLGGRFLEGDLKVYGDKPELREEMSNGTVRSFRKEQYTIIPQKSGILTLPEISIPWWDVSKNTVAYSKIPARTLEILPGPEKTVSEPFPPATENIQTMVQSQAAAREVNPIIYLMMALLTVLLFAAFFWVFTLQRKIARLTESPKKEAKDTNTKREKQVQKNYGLDSITTPGELKLFLEFYAQTEWGTPPNPTLKFIFDSALQRSPSTLHSDIRILEKTLEDALYRNQSPDMPEMVRRCSLILKEAAKKLPQGTKKKEKLPDLNPS